MNLFSVPTVGYLQLSEEKNEKCPGGWARLKLIEPLKATSVTDLISNSNGENGYLEFSLLL